MSISRWDSKLYTKHRVITFRSSRAAASITSLLMEKHHNAARAIAGAIFVAALFLGLPACGDASNVTRPSPTVQSGTVVSSTPGLGPTVILSPTSIPGGSGDNTQGQVVKLADRVLTISNVSKQAGADASSTRISLTISVKNTGARSIMNEASFFQLLDAEGDAFGLQSSAATNFFGAITPQSSRSGTINFQVPTGALKGLRLLYRPEVAAETTILPLNV